MFIPAWLVAIASLLFVILAAWTFLLASGRNPLPFPDNGSRIFAASSPQAKDAVVSLLVRHGLKPRFEFNTEGVQRTILWDGTIINYSSPPVTQKLGAATSSIGMVTDNPSASAQHAVDFLRARGFEAHAVLDAEPELPIAFVISNAMPGTALNFRKHVIHLPRPQPAAASDD